MLNKSSIALLVAVVLGAGGVAVYVSKHKKLTPAEAEAERVRLANERDRHALKEKTAGEADIYGALIRLDQNKESQAREESLKRAASPSALIRGAAANGLGYFSDAETMKTIRQLLQDPDRTVRVQALNGLGHDVGKEREDLLEATIKSPGADPSEVVAAWSSMVTAAPEQTMRETAVGSLVKLAQDPHVPLNQVNIAAIKALSVAPQDERVIKMLKKFLEEGDNTAVVPVALRHLAGMRDASVDPYLKKMIDSDNPEIRIAVVQGLRFSCFPDRYSLLNQVIRKDREKVVVNTAIEQLRLMPTEASNKILQDIIDDGVLQENESRAARSAIVDIRRSVGTAMADPCAPPKKTAHENSKG